VSSVEQHDSSLRARLRSLDAAWERRIGALEPWQRRALLVALCGALAAFLVVVVASIAFASIYLSAPVPTPAQLEGFEPSVVLDHDGERVETLEPVELRRDVPLDELPDHVPQAVLAAEDRRFHDHGGFSPRDIARAAWSNLTPGGVRQGASTITQQYVDIALADTGGGYLGKLREVAIAARVDDELAKDDILDAYLNQVPFGREAVGIEAAAQIYFGVAATDLELEQAATLAGMIAAPTAFDPARHPEAAAERRDFVLDGMRQMGVLDEEQAGQLIGSELPELREGPLREFGPDTYFLEMVRRQVPELVDDPDIDVAEGLTVHTTLDQRAQKLAVEQLAAHLSDAPYTGAAVTIESESGAVRALAGGLDAEEQQFDVATSGDRQAGSAFKTFALAEFVSRGYDPDATRVDAPEEYDIGVADGEDATVANYSGSGHGEVSVREATAESINTAYVRLAEELGPAEIAATAGELGISSELHEFPSLVLGTAEVRPFEMTVAYATLSASGTRQQPFLVERIEAPDGEVLYEHEPDPEEVIDPNVAHVVTDVLVDVVESGTGIAANLPRPNAGKTGTTNDFRDAWFVGYTPQHTTTVWVGNLDNSPMEGEVAGGSLPAQIWAAYMSAFVEPFDVREFPVADTTGLRPLTGLEAPEEDDRDDRDDGEDDEGEDDEGEEDEEDDAGSDDDGRGPDGDGPPGQRN
jgi:penicillin-binding protein 1A